MITRPVWFLIALLIVSVYVQIQSSIPAELPFVVIFSCMSIMPFRAILWITLLTGCVLDVFSPIKGLSLFSYLSASLGCVFLGRHFLTHRSLPAFFTLGISGWALLILTKWLLFAIASQSMGGTGWNTIISLDMLLRVGRGFLTVSVALILFYLLLIPVQSIKRRSSFSDPL